LVVPKFVVEWFLGGLAKTTHIVDDCSAGVAADFALTRVLIGTAKLLHAEGGACFDAVFLRGDVVGIEEVYVGGVFLLVIAGVVSVVHRIIHRVEIFWMETGIHFEKMKKEVTKRVSAKMAAMMVQRQSVHFRYFSSTGKLRKV